ncbi:glycosyltransferase family 4 protein [Pseudidiomarina donghaiensis]|uniref:Glycosyl transferase family 1 domain-containing protein n=1 Tax=Pseudidiomarina donghaiensis TaxID=519452 RepID=A0A432XKU3_9GAMM|nr:glycosyltransferase family 4 protein [Pseudidiomarina donghaiensis]RUO49322.1 hypothetical protein CWE24_02110 [Pseudidiomarina donghaiensis]SFV20988.1 Glycosyltransferase involved in cell wall bisynthesis [Pseudidiomarina donghaiensis]
MLVHISNNYLYSAVHSNLTIAMADGYNTKQLVFTPLKSSVARQTRNLFHEDIEVCAPRVIPKGLRYLPLTKVLVSFVVFCKTMKAKKVSPSFLIAHNLWSDGMIAWLTYKLKGINYTVAVRNADINTFIPRLRIYHWLIRQVLNNASTVVFVNKAYQLRLSNQYPKLSLSIRNSKTIYNGIDNFWYLARSKKSSGERTRSVCYVGDFTENKNLKASFRAVEILNEEGRKVEYRLIGGTVDEFLSVVGIDRVPNWVSITPRTSDLQVISKLLQSSRVFLMPSYRETFGLAYIEALSQGCAVVHSKNEGIDGIFDEDFVRAVDPFSVSEIKNVLSLLLDRYPCGTPREVVEQMIEQFKWKNIGQEYLRVVYNNRQSFKMSN